MLTKRDSYNARLLLGQAGACLPRAGELASMLTDEVAENTGAGRGGDWSGVCLHRTRVSWGRRVVCN